MVDRLSGTFWFSVYEHFIWTQAGHDRRAEWSAT